WSFAGGTNYKSDSGTVDDSISQADAHTQVTDDTGADTSYHGNSHTATGSWTDVFGVSHTTGFTLSGTTHTDAGTYTGDAWSFAGDRKSDEEGKCVDDSIAHADAQNKVTGYNRTETTYDGNALAAP